MNNQFISQSSVIAAASFSVLALVAVAVISPIVSAVILGTAFSASLITLTVASYQTPAPRFSTLALARKLERHPLAA